MEPILEQFVGVSKGQGIVIEPINYMPLEKLNNLFCGLEGDSFPLLRSRTSFRNVWGVY